MKPGKVQFYDRFAVNLELGSPFLASDAASLSKNGGTLGMDVGASQQITDGDLTFDVLAVNAVRPGTPADGAGFHPGDEIIAVNARVFPTVAAFAAFVGSMTPGSQITVDYIPAGGGPQQAQRVAVTLGGGAATAVPTQANNASVHTGLSGKEKLAIGVGAAALFGCYKLGCFSHFGVKSQP
jgi:C-terminal processing protease CtpA/Prc